MLVLETFLYYIFYSSVILIYGIGLNKVASFGISKNFEFAFYTKAILTIFTTSTISWLINQKILIPLKLLELAPLIIFLVFICVNSLLQTLVLIITGKKSSEFTSSYLIILLSLSESCSLLNTLIINICCMLALLILILMCYAFKTRILENGHKFNEKYYSLFFCFLAAVILITSTFDVMWINPGVLK